MIGPAASKPPAQAPEPRVRLSLSVTRYQLAFLALMALALGLRLWDLGGRAIHYDEGLHAWYSWALLEGGGYRHEPWIHGPLQFFLNASVFAVFWDSDYTVRLTYVFFGVALVGLPYFLRDYIGRVGALLAAVMLTFSPAMFFFSRYIRNDIYMGFWTLALVILMWRYIEEGKDRYLYLAAATLALAFATKETAYIVVAVLGLFLFLVSWRDVLGRVAGGLNFSRLGRPGAFLLLLFTLTLPQWAALFSVFQGSGEGGVVLAYSGDDAAQPTGLPLWAEPFVSVSGLGGLTWFDAGLGSVLALLAVAAFLMPARRFKIILAAVVLVGLRALVWLLLSFIDAEVSRNYAIAAGILAAVGAVAAMLGLRWRWRVWLTCAFIFYGVWLLFYTALFGAVAKPFANCPEALSGAAETVCARYGGAFTGMWQSLGYWLAQQEVARGNQPWHYYIMLVSVYEFLPMAVGLAAVVYYMRRRSRLGLFLVFWALVTFLAYTVASEKMPWLLVNITLPFIILSAKLLNDVLTRMPWGRVCFSSRWLLIPVSPLLLMGVVYLLRQLLSDDGFGGAEGWGALAAVALLMVAFSALLDRAGVGRGLVLGGLGVAVLMLGFGAFVGARAGYGTDDGPVELIVYAGASEELRQAARELADEPSLQKEGAALHIDYELWYPLNWYVRDYDFVQYRCYENKAGCTPITDPPTVDGLMLLDTHASRFTPELGDYVSKGPYRELLWFPEVYRRGGEDRMRETILKEVWEDLKFGYRVMSGRSAWRDTLNYFLYREIGHEWWETEMYIYTPRDA